MLYQDTASLTELPSTGARIAPMSGALPSSFVLTGESVAALRAYLDDRGLSDYRIYYCSNHDLHDIDNYLADLDKSAAWEPCPPAGRNPEPLTVITYDTKAARGWESGVLRLAKFECVIARWYWVDSRHSTPAVWLVAAPSPDHYFKLHREIETRRHARGAAAWQIVRGAYCNDERIPREPTKGDDLLLSEEIHQRVHADILHFFDAEAAELYRSLGVPHRRGVLLHGPPGNGKTSTIRYIGSVLRHIPAMILRTTADFDSDDLEQVLARWRRQAPAILVIEDLNWLLQAVNVSTFLNQLDGIESDMTGGLLLIATTNHPDALDPAINNRPGRFDVVIEIPCPARPLRVEFFRRKCPGLDEPTIDRLAAQTERMSFAHLQEILRLAGLFSLHATRRARTPDDLLRAAKVLQATQSDADRGFPTRPETPFGLAGWTRR
ncbi:MAG TPA: ATP-binding protein [Tepidisphaeraceae bacterium]|nr:ATP-binding protein [Tepidisphaeraceae bacterium]